MGASTTRGTVTGRADADAVFAAEGCTEPRPWGNGPDERYGWHEHGFHKVLFCLEGSITFHLRDAEDVTLTASDRLDLAPGTEHAATVGPGGCACVEATRP